MIDVYTDGSCVGNPGPGGWAYLIIGKLSTVVHKIENSEHSPFDFSEK